MLKLVSAIVMPTPATPKAPTTTARLRSVAEAPRPTPIEDQTQARESR